MMGKAASAGKMKQHYSKSGAVVKQNKDRAGAARILRGAKPARRETCEV
jgi:hypothetical protein